MGKFPMPYSFFSNNFNTFAYGVRGVIPSKQKY